MKYYELFMQRWLDIMHTEYEYNSFKLLNTLMRAYILTGHTRHIGWDTIASIYDSDLFVYSPLSHTAGMYDVGSILLVLRDYLECTYEFDDLKEGQYE